MKKAGLYRIALAVGSLAASFALLEILSRNHAPRSDDQLYDPSHVHFLIDAAGPLMTTRRIGGVEYLVTKAAESRYVLSQKIPLRKRPGRKRIVVVGESSALGLGAALGFYAGRAAPRFDDEVLNMGFGGASLEQVENNYAEALRYDPDVLILCFGHNLMMRHPALGPFELRFNGLIRRSHFLSLVLDSRKHPIFVPPVPSERMELFRRFIRAAARSARERKIPLMICTMPSNLEYPPISDDRERDADVYLRSIYEAASGRDERAGTLLQDAADRDPVPLWNFQTAQGLLRKRAYAAARARFLSAKDLDRQHDRAASQVNALIRATAAEEKLTVLDFDRLATESAPHRIPGWESFIDHVHASSRLGGREAAESWKECARVLHGVVPATSAPAPGNPSWEEFALDAARRGLPFQDQRSAAVRALFMDELRLNASFPGQLRALLADEAKFLPSSNAASARAHLALNAAEALFWCGRAREAAAFIDMARDWSPDWAEPQVAAGLLALRFRRPEEARLRFAAALKLEPGRRDAEFFLERSR